MRLVRDTIDFTAAEMPRWHSISISGYHIREAGSTAAEELAFTLANGFAYVELALAAGLPVDAFAPRLSFFFNAHIDFFEEIAKYRAARRIWARWMKERYGAQSDRSLQLRFHTQTAGVSLTAQQPEVNIVRTAIEALAGVLGGTQSLHTNSMDEALALPTERAARIALRTQQVIAYETNVANVADPLGGSYFVESLTDEVERQAEQIFEYLDELGSGSILEGVIRGIEENWFQGKIGDSAYELERKFNADRRTIIGVNRFLEGNDEVPIDILQITNEDEARQIKRLDVVRRERNAAAVAESLDRLAREAADPEVNLMPTLIDTVKSYATLGEIMGTLAGVFGRHVEVPDHLTGDLTSRTPAAAGPSPGRRSHKGEALHDPSVMPARLAAFLAEQEPDATDIEVISYEVMTGGYSRVLARADGDLEPGRPRPRRSCSSSAATRRPTRA